MIQCQLLRFSIWGEKKVVQETINALKSMMSTNDVMAFSTLCEKDKIESLFGIREIVCGMRAFNKDAGHCGEGLIDSKYKRAPFRNHKNGHCTFHLNFCQFYENYSENERKQRIYGTIYTSKITIICIFQ